MTCALKQQMLPLVIFQLCPLIIITPFLWKQYKLFPFACKGKKVEKFNSLSLNLDGAAHGTLLTFLTISRVCRNNFLARS